MKVRLFFISTAVLMAVLLSLDLAAAQETENLTRYGDFEEGNADPTKWRLNLGKATSRELSVSHRKSFPILYAGVDCGGQSSRFGFRIPFDLSKGIYSSSLEMGANVAFTYVSSKTHTEAFENSKSVLTPLTYTLSYNRFRRPSMRNLYPRWGQTAQISYSHTSTKGYYKGAMFSAQVGLFLPGLFKQHSLNIECAYEGQKPDNYHFKSELGFPRGYSYVYREDIYRASINYNMPLLYPNLSLGPLFHLDRIRANIFYDHGIGRDGGYNTLYNSVGTELMMDITLSTLPIAFDLGVRFAYRLRDSEYRIEPVCFAVSF